MNYTTVLEIDINSTITEWYLPICDYVGTLYISQYSSTGSQIGSGIYNVSSNSSSFNIIINQFSDIMSLTWLTRYTGLKFAAVDLKNYSLSVLFTGIIKIGSFPSFTSVSPVLNTLTVLSGTAPTIYSTDNNTYTAFAFYSDAVMNCIVDATILGTDTTNSSGYYTYLIDSTEAPLGYDGSNGATCTYLHKNVDGVTQFKVTFNSNATKTLLDIQTLLTIVYKSTVHVDYFSEHPGGAGGTGNASYGGGGGGAGGIFCVGNDGDDATTTSAGSGGMSGDARNPIGIISGSGETNLTSPGSGAISMNGLDGTTTGSGGVGGGGKKNSAAPSSGAMPGFALVTLKGHWILL